MSIFAKLHEALDKTEVTVAKVAVKVKEARAEADRKVLAFRLKQLKNQALPLRSRLESAYGLWDNLPHIEDLGQKELGFGVIKMFMVQADIKDKDSLFTALSGNEMVAQIYLQKPFKM